MSRLSALTRHGALASGVALACAALVAGAAAPAALAAPSGVHAASRPAGQSAGNPSDITFSLLAATAKGPDNRLKYVYDNIAPGSVIHDYVALVNRSTGAAFSVYGSDATGTTLSNALTFDLPNQKPTDIGSWVTFKQNNSKNLSMVIGAKQGILTPFTISVPSFATPGDHTGAVIAAIALPRTDSKGHGVIVYQRIAVPIELRVTGRLHAGLRAQSVSAGFNNTLNPFASGSVRVTFTVANTGNVRMAGVARVAVTGGFGQVSVIRPPKLPVVLPGDSVQVTATLPGLYPAGPMDAHVSVTPAIAPGATATGLKAPGLSQEVAGLFAVPWALLGLIVLLAGAGAGVWYYLRWRRRQNEAVVTEAIARARRDTARTLLGARSGAGSAGGAATVPDSAPEASSSAQALAGSTDSSGSADGQDGQDSASGPGTDGPAEGTTE
jgi:hypothetical protein